MSAPLFSATASTPSRRRGIILSDRLFGGDLVAGRFQINLFPD
jgi:hypothetical protein